MTDKKPVGRPRKTLDDLPKGWKEKMLELGDCGASDAEMREEALDGMCTETWYSMQRDFEEFSETVKKAQQKSMIFWEHIGMKGMHADKFNAAVYIFSMKNRFSRFYKDKVEVGSDPDNPIKVETTTTFVSAEQAAKAYQEALKGK